MGIKDNLVAPPSVSGETSAGQPESNLARVAGVIADAIHNTDPLYRRPEVSPLSGEVCDFCFGAKEIAASSESVMACPKCQKCQYGCTREQYCVSCKVHRPRKLDTLSGETCSVCPHSKHSGQCTEKLVTDGGTQCPCVMAFSGEAIAHALNKADLPAHQPYRGGASTKTLKEAAQVISNQLSREGGERT